MKTSESIKAIAPAFLAAQMAIQHVVKDKTGKILTKSGREYEYKYSDLTSVIEQVKGPLNAQGIAFIQSPGGDAAGVTVTTTFMHTSGEWFADTIYMPVVNSGAQALGSLITYGKRYQLQSMTGLPSEDDDGKAASPDVKDEPKKEEAPKQKYGNNGAEVCKIEFDRLTPDEQTSMRLHGSIVIACKTPEFASEYIDKQSFSHEERMALWYLLPSGLRSNIKKVQASQLATQA